MASWCLTHLHEVDGILIGQGRRLRDLSTIELLNFCYALIVKDASPEQRDKVDKALAGMLGDAGGEIVDDPDLPEQLQGMEAPAWWKSDHDPFSDTINLKNTDVGR